MDKKYLRFKIGSLGDDGVIEGHGSVAGNVDLGGDVVKGGAFDRDLKTKAAQGSKMPILFSHDPEQPIGVWTEVREDAKGLYVKGQLNLDVQRAREIHSLLKQGAIKGLSIGYDVVKDQVVKGIRYLLELKLWEVSVVTFPMNTLAAVESVKHLRLTKAVTSFGDLPLADKDRAWDASAAEKRVREWAKADDAPNAKYREAFVYYDPDKADQFGGYKFPIADVIDGKLEAIPRAIFAAAGRLDGSDISDADKVKAKAHLAKYYKKLDMDPPWKADKFMASFDDQLADYSIYSQWRDICDVLDSQRFGLLCSMDADGMSSDEKLAAWDQVLNQHHAAALAWMSNALAEEEDEKSTGGATRQSKAGRVLSKTTRESLMEVHDHVHEARKKIKALLESADAGDSAESGDSSKNADPTVAEVPSGRAEAGDPQGNEGEGNGAIGASLTSLLEDLRRPLVSPAQSSATR